MSLFGGQGASLARAGAVVLAEELGFSRDIAGALQRYERRMKPSVARRQRSARRVARYFVPAGPGQLAMRDLAMRLARTPVGEWLMRRRLAADEILARPSPT